VYVANLMTEPGESAGLDLEAHVASLQAFGGLGLAAVIANDARLPASVLRRYLEEGGAPLIPSGERVCGVPLFARPLLDPEEPLARHHSTLLNQALREVIQSL
jgi:2-phospho-L-lactate transferase/gluconeogenesis factor (CofD/UPF0052 family)